MNLKKLMFLKTLSGGGSGGTNLLILNADHYISGTVPAGNITYLENNGVSIKFGAAQYAVYSGFEISEQDVGELFTVSGNGILNSDTVFLYTESGYVDKSQRAYAVRPADVGSTFCFRFRDETYKPVTREITNVKLTKDTSDELYNETLFPLTSGWINGGDGASGSGSSYKKTSDFVPCARAAGKQITLNKRPGGGNPGFGFYSDASASSFISGEKNLAAEAGTPWTITVPATAKFMRFTVPASDSTNISVKITG